MQQSSSLLSELKTEAQRVTILVPGFRSHLSKPSVCPRKYSREKLLLLVPARPCPSSSSSSSSSTSTDAARPDTLSAHARPFLWAGPRRSCPPSTSQPRPVRGAAGSYCRLGGRGRRGFPLGPLSESRDPGGKAPTPKRRPPPAAVLDREWAAAGG